MADGGFLSGFSSSSGAGESFSAPDDVGDVLNSSNFEISYSWEDRPGVAAPPAEKDANGEVGGRRRLVRRGKGNVAFLNASNCPSGDDSGLDSSLSNSFSAAANG